MKNEYLNDTIVEFCGLRSKTYSLLMLGESSSSKAKGVNQKCCKLRHEDYVKCLHTLSSKRGDSVSIRSIKKVSFIIDTRKKVLAPISTKRYRVNATESYPFGHNAITKIRDQEQADDEVQNMDWE